MRGTASVQYMKRTTVYHLCTIYERHNLLCTIHGTYNCVPPVYNIWRAQPPCYEAVMYILCVLTHNVSRMCSQYGVATPYWPESHVCPPPTITCCPEWQGHRYTSTITCCPEWQDHRYQGWDKHVMVRRSHLPATSRSISYRFTHYRHGATRIRSFHTKGGTSRTSLPGRVKYIFLSFQGLKRQFWIASEWKTGPGLWGWPWRDHVGVPESVVSDRNFSHQKVRVTINHPHFPCNCSHLDMHNLALGTYLVKYNPIYTVSDRPNIALRKPVSTPVVRWEFYKMEFKNIFPHTR